MFHLINLQYLSVAMLNHIYFLDEDGLPYIGRKMVEGTPLYCYFDGDRSTYNIVKFKGKEECFLHSVKMCGDFNAKTKKTVCITYRVPVSIFIYILQSNHIVFIHFSSVIQV